jgi:hypothetical protein
MAVEQAGVEGKEEFRRGREHDPEGKNDADAHCLEKCAKSHRAQQKSGLHPFLWSENVPELSYQLQRSPSPLGQRAN